MLIRVNFRKTDRKPPYFKGDRTDMLFLRRHDMDVFTVSAPRIEWVCCFYDFEEVAGCVW